MLPHLMQLNSVVQAIVASGEIKIETSSYGTKYDANILRYALEKRGYKVLGNGHFSVAITTLETEMRNTVIKIGGCVTDAWLAFAVYAMNNPAPWLPNILSIHMNKTFYIVEMEHLGHYEDANDKIEAWRADVMHSGYTGYVTEAMGILKHIEGPELAAMKYALGDPTDMHSGNYMWRDDQIVLLDPYHMTIGRLPSAPVGDWQTEQVKHEDHRTELPATSEGTTTRREEEVQPLREQPKHDTAQRLAQGMGILPQMRKSAWIRPQWIAQPRAIRRVYEARPQQDDKRPFRLRTGIQGRRADFIVVDDVAAKGRSLAGAEKRVWHWLQQKPRTSHIARMEQHFRDAGITISPAEPAAEVHTGQRIPEYLRVPKQARKGHVQEPARAEPAVRCGFRGGRAECDKGWRVHTDGLSTGHLARVRQVGANLVHILDAQFLNAALWGVAGPGQGRAGREQQAIPVAYLDGVRLRDCFLA